MSLKGSNTRQHQGGFIAQARPLMGKDLGEGRGPLWRRAGNMHTYFRVKLDDSNLIDWCHGWAHDNASEEVWLHHVEMEILRKKYRGMDGGGRGRRSKEIAERTVLLQIPISHPQAKRLGQILTEHLPIITTKHGAQYTTSPLRDS